MNQHIILDKSWQNILDSEFELPYMQQLELFLNKERALGKTIYPDEKQYFNALNMTPFEQVKVVIVGQDPYHGEGQAHGLCFSVASGMRIPPSLVNIYKELANDLAIRPPNHGCLEHWAGQGVLLLNSVLTVEASKAGSHQKKGWELFTDHIMAQLHRQHEHLVFILWGADAQKKGAKIDVRRHLVLKGVHPSPLSAYRGFSGQGYFSKANAYLQHHGKTQVDWRLPMIHS